MSSLFLALRTCIISFSHCLYFNPFFRRHKSRNLENLAGADVVLTEQDLKDVNDAIATHSVIGDRGIGNDAAVYLWG